MRSRQQGAGRGHHGTRRGRLRWPRGDATTAEPFAPEALYEIKIDTDGDAVADIAYQVGFTPSEDGAQTATLRRVEGVQAAGTGEGDG